MVAVAFSAVFPVSCVPQSPVQLVAVAPMVALPPVRASTLSVHCGAKVAVSVNACVVPSAEPTVGVHAPVPLQPFVQPGGLDVQPVKR